VQERPLETNLLFLKRLLDPLILKQLAACSREIFREKNYRPRGGPDFGAVILGKSLRPLLELRNLILSEQEPIITDDALRD